MSKIHAVLLIPAEGDPLGLLAKSALGIIQEASPPVVKEWGCSREIHQSWVYGAPCGCLLPSGNPAHVVWGTGRRALVLAWGGGVVSSGVFRAWWHTDDSGYSEPSGLGDALDGLDNLVSAVGCWYRLAPVPSGYERHRIGTIILLDENGNEVTP